MHLKNMEPWKHRHRFNIDDADSERNTRFVVVLTLFMMFIEIAGGYIFGSMALLADGWHMGTHAFALGITAFAYYFARKHADDPRYCFGTGKVGVLGGFASAVVLAVVAMMMAAESIERLVDPRVIHFNEAIIVAVIGLVVNIVSAFLLQGHHHHSHGHDHDHEDHHDHEEHHDHHDHDAHTAQVGHTDHNLRAAYMHVLADALTSVLAIIALFAGKSLGWVWMDPVMGIVGSVIIMRWSYGLLMDTGKILLDRDISPETVESIKTAIEADADNRVADIHVWRIGSEYLSGIISVVTHHPKPPAYYKELLKNCKNLDHLTVEVIRCEGDSCTAT